MFSRFMLGLGFSGELSQVLHHRVSVNLAHGVQLAFEFVLALEFQFALELTFEFTFTLNLAFTQQATDNIADRAEPAFAFQPRFPKGFQLAFQFAL
jgi:hypothetical protein